MEILNFDALAADRRIIDIDTIDPSKAYVIIGVSNSKSITEKYPPYMISLDQIGGLSDTVQRTGTALTFDREAFYGSIATPETGNFSVDFTGAKIGTTSVVFHNSGSEPTYPGTMIELTGSEVYVPGSLNYYFIIYLGGATAGYVIKQNA